MPKFAVVDNVSKEPVSMKSLYFTTASNLRAASRYFTHKNNNFKENIENGYWDIIEVPEFRIPAEVMPLARRTPPEMIQDTLNLESRWEDGGSDLLDYEILEDRIDLIVQKDFTVSQGVEHCMKMLTKMKRVSKGLNIPIIAHIRSKSTEQFFLNNQFSKVNNAELQWIP